jgi:hypothetical protein
LYIAFFFPSFFVSKRLKMTCKWSRFNKEKERGEGEGANGGQEKTR